MKLIILLASAILTLVEGQLPIIPYPKPSKVKSHIINGTAALPNEYPYQVGVFTYVSATSGMACGASLIHTNWVLSAAHCFPGGIKIQLRFGSVSYSTGGITRDINMSELYVHPFYKIDGMINATGSVNPVHDIALIKLLVPVALSTSIQTIKLLPKSMFCTNQLRTFHASGWGLTWDRSQGGTTTDQLMWTKMYEVPTYDCMRNIYGVISVNHMCSGGNGTQSTCSGDSGGPLVIRGSPHYQVGLNSFGSSSCISRNPRVQTMVTPYLDWMKYVTGIDF